MQPTGTIFCDKHGESPTDLVFDGAVEESGCVHCLMEKYNIGRPQEGINRGKQVQARVDYYEKCMGWKPIGAAYEHYKIMAGKNMRAYIESKSAQHFVRRKKGVWNHDDWLQYVRVLTESTFWPIDISAVGGELEYQKRLYLYGPVGVKR